MKKVLFLFMGFFLSGPTFSDARSQRHFAREESAMDPQHVETAIRSKLTTIIECYRQELKTQPDLEGTVSMEFKVSSQGVLKKIRVQESDLPNARVPKCIIRVLRALRFPKLESKYDTQFSYPFVFRSHTKAMRAQREHF